MFVIIIVVVAAVELWETGLGAKRPEPVFQGAEENARRFPGGCGRGEGNAGARDERGGVGRVFLTSSIASGSSGSSTARRAQRSMTRRPPAGLLRVHA